VRKILWAVVVAVSLGGAAAPLAVASPAPAACKRAKKAKLVKPGKYKVQKFKVKKVGKGRKQGVKRASVASPKPLLQPAPDPAPGKASE
jgi:hypothetical protein